MQCCDKLIHPFQNDPGVSQNQRVMESLLNGATKIDGRSLADLLNYFVKLSRHINYYDPELKVSDWQPFFNNSIPFSIAAIINYDEIVAKEKFELYKTIFNKNPSTSGLQLSAHFIFFSSIHLINQWHLKVKGSELPLESMLEQLIRNKLLEPTKRFIASSNAAAKWYCISRLDFSSLQNNEVWNLNIQDLHSLDESFKQTTNNNLEQLQMLHGRITGLFSTYLEAIKTLSLYAENSLEPSLLPLKEELKEKHPPHLSLLFAFLNMFKQLQGHLNGFSKKHLDFFYRDVLQLKAKEAVPDKAHVVFEIQKQLQKYLLKKGLLVKDSKDDNKQEILFSLDDELVVNKTQVAEVRTLFLNNQNEQDHNYLQGVYTAPNAYMADGVDKPFEDDSPKSFRILGDKPSKYIAPGKTYYQNYPHGRVGFILASPVLLLNEGRRNVTITLACQLNDQICSPDYPTFFPAEQLYNKVKRLFRKTYYLVTQDLIDEAVKLGISQGTSDKLKQFLFDKNKNSCEGTVEIYKTETVVTAGVWYITFFHQLNDQEKEIISKIFKTKRIFKLHYSGEKEWIEPSHYRRVKFTPLTTFADGSKRFAIKITTILKPDKPAVTFYDKEKLKEDFNTELPLVKLELDDNIKLLRGFNLTSTTCCLRNPGSSSRKPLSFYHFLRNIIIVKENDEQDIFGHTYQTKIDVKVCGLRNFVVQNDESVQDVNSPIYPFGTRPDINDFNVVNPSTLFCITQQLIDDADSPPINIQPATKTQLEDLLIISDPYHVGITNEELDDFIATLTVPVDRPKIKNLLQDPNKDYCPKDLVGPNFYIGSKEIFFKDWEHLWMNINWKEKPISFNDYYKAYVLRENGTKIYGLDEDQFEMNLGVLDKGVWHLEHNGANTRINLNPTTNHFNRELYKDDRFEGISNTCTPLNPVQQVVEIKSEFFNHSKTYKKFKEITEYTKDTAEGFIKITLENQDFLHKEYAFVLARQMMALGRLPEVALEGAVYIEHGTNNIITFKGSIVLINQLLADITAIETLSDTVFIEVQAIINSLLSAINPLGPDGPTINPAELAQIVTAINALISSGSVTTIEGDLDGLLTTITNLQNIFSFFDLSGNVLKPLEVPIPNEPWTPIIEDLILDYTASASLENIDLIHLYPYHGTYLAQELGLKPTLLPTHCDEGTLFIGLKNLVPNSNVNILFQLAEATADSEMNRVPVNWHYLDNNQWRALRTGFEVLEDATDGLTTSGVVKLALPENMTIENSVMPSGLHWIKASVKRNSKTISEVLGLHTQAIRTTFTNEDRNDKLRLDEPLSAGKLSKMEQADASVKKVLQPYDSFLGRLPEASGHYYVRVSELLRHKGRALQKFDHERLALEAFPQIFKAKCIPHSLGLNANAYKNDFPLSPGYVLLAVVPDLRKLKASNSFEPKVPVSLLDDIHEYLVSRTSPFVRLGVKNPRYEYVDFSLEVKLFLGKDENFYKELLIKELREFLAPWAIGEYDKLSFGQCIYRSDIVQFLETRDYLDYIIELKMAPENEAPDNRQNVCPATPRSILLAGNIDLCITQNDCEEWTEEVCPNPAVLVVDYCNENPH